MSKAKMKVLLVGGCLCWPAPGRAQAQVKLLNVSYDPTRELYQDVNKAFAAQWKQKTGQSVDINQSHGGSGKQARSIIDGLEADVATLALAYDIDAIAAELRPHQERLAEAAAQQLGALHVDHRVRREEGQPARHQATGAIWPSPGPVVVTPNPKTSGGARWNYLAAWAWAKKQFGGDQAKVKEFIRTLYKNVPVLDSGARGSTITFAQRGIGHVLLAWENEAYYLVEEMGKNKFEIITPSMSILAEPSVAVVDKNVDKHGTRAAAEAYLSSSTPPEGQEIAAKHHYRPRDPAVGEASREPLRQGDLVTIDGAFGGWQKAQKDAFRRRRDLRSDLSAGLMSVAAAPPTDGGRRQHAASRQPRRVARVSASRSATR